MALALFALLITDGWLIYKRSRYNSEVARLRDGMTASQRQQADVLVASEENKLRVTMELIRRQIAGDKKLHLAISVDSGMMYLGREGAILREIPAQLGEEKRVGTLPDTVVMALPRGTRTVERILGPRQEWEVPKWVFTDRGLAVPAERSIPGALGPTALMLSGGTVVYTLPSAGPLNDSAYVLPGSVRVRAADLQAVLPNLSPGTTVYFY